LIGFLFFTGELIHPPSQPPILLNRQFEAALQCRCPLDRPRECFCVCPESLRLLRACPELCVLRDLFIQSSDSGLKSPDLLSEFVRVCRALLCLSQSRSGAFELRR
jgi:hypothetical protein